MLESVRNLIFSGKIVMQAEKSPTISKDQFKRLTEDLLKESAEILESRDRKDPKMDRESTLLAALYARLCEKLNIPPKSKFKTDFSSYEVAIRTELYETLRTYARQPFEYRPIINEFLERAKRAK